MIVMSAQCNHTLRFFVGATLVMLVAPGALAQNADSASLSGVVRRATDNRALADVEVWVPSQDLRALTDSTGAYRLTGLTGGIVLVQLRRVGYEARRDTVTVAPQGETRRDFVLAAQGATLDTVRTVAAKTKYLSARLQAFEERRTNGGGGKFIGDSVLRANDQRSLGSIILQYAPSATLVTIPGQGGARYMASTRKRCSGPAFGNVRGLKRVCEPCYTSIYVDGAPVYSSKSLEQQNAPPPPDIYQIQNDQLTGVEYYTGGANLPPEFVHTDSGCGVLLLWTRER